MRLLSVERSARPGLFWLLVSLFVALAAALFATSFSLL